MRLRTAAMLTATTAACLCLALIMMMSSALASKDDPTCVSGCSEVAPVCGADGRTYQSECLASCQDVAVAAVGACADPLGKMLEPRSGRISRQQMDAFKSEGFKLIGYGRAKAFTPKPPTVRDGQQAKVLSSAEMAKAGMLQAVRYTADGLIYVASLTKAQAGAMIMSSGGASSESYIPPGMPIANLSSVSGAGQDYHSSRKLNVLFAPDTRKEITFKAMYPYSAIGRLRSANGVGGGGSSCSGAMVSARSVLTAGHCVYDRDTRSWQKSFQFAANQHSGSTAPFGNCPFATATAFTGYTNARNDDESWIWDIAVVQLGGTCSGGGSGATLGSRTGYFGMQWVPSSSNIVLNTAGYPGDKRSGTYWYTSCQVSDSNGNDGAISHFCDTYPGQSGSPMYVVQNGAYNIRGVVSYGVTNSRGPVKNVACEITKNNFDSLVKLR